eukprot:8108184-Karenia_brevis.AAC.1
MQITAQRTNSPFASALLESSSKTRKQNKSYQCNARSQTSKQIESKQSTVNSWPQHKAVP